MNRTTFDTMWDQIRQKYGVYLRLIEALPEAQLQMRPIPGMRSPAELVAHLSSGIVRAIVVGIAGGVVAPEDEVEIALRFRDKKEVLDFARDCWKEADRIARQLTDEQLASMVDAWGMQMSVASLVDLMNDELVHHRGQLYAYARLLGAEPPFIRSHSENALDFAPRGP